MIWLAMSPNLPATVREDAKPHPSQEQMKTA